MSDILTKLTALITDRAAHPKPGSYTNRLLDNPTKAAQKVGEEATEVVIAALTESDERLVSETADLMYHCLVLLQTRGIAWEAVLSELEGRHQ